MATLEYESLTQAPLSSQNGTWGLLLLEHLEEFANLVWYLVVDGNLVDEIFFRTMTQFDATPFDASIPELAYNQARETLITQAIAAVAAACEEEEESVSVFPASMGELPDLPRLAFMLRLVVRSSEMAVV